VTSALIVASANPKFFVVTDASPEAMLRRPPRLVMTW